MARDASQYTVTAPLELDEELQELDWFNPADPPIDAAADIIYEMLTQQQPERGIQEIIQDVAPNYRQQVITAVLERSVNEPAATAESKTLRDNVDYAADPAAEWDWQRTREILHYVATVTDEATAHRLAELMDHSRNLAIRQMPGTDYIYGDDTHERYIRCIQDLPAAVAAKQAAGNSDWSLDQIAEAVTHEVNHMEFRLNLEIRDRLYNQLTKYQDLPQYAAQHGINFIAVHRLQEMEASINAVVAYQRKAVLPSYENIERTAQTYTVQCAIIEAIERQDNETIMQLTQPFSATGNLRTRAEAVYGALPHENQQMIEQALETAATDYDAVKDGGTDFRFPFAVLRYKYANAAREEWLAQMGLTDQRETTTGDCVTRALNEAAGGEQYGPIWEQLTYNIQRIFPERDADQGVNPIVKDAAYQHFGMTPLIDTALYGNDYVMHKHIDLREIPAMLGTPAGEPVTYLACSQTHAVAVVNGVLRDTWDSRNMGKPDADLKRDGGLVELWVRKADQAMADAFNENLLKYEEVRKYDDALTYGAMTRRRPQ